MGFAAWMQRNCNGMVDAQLQASDARAEARSISLSELVNALLRKAIEVIKAVK